MYFQVKFELDRSDNSFFFLCLADDAENYKVKILNIALLVPVAQLSASVFNEISSILTRKNEPKAIGIHYRRVEVRPISLPRNKEEYNSDGLFTDSDLPCKIVLCFVKTKSKVGDYHENPFEFRRKWTIPKPSQINVQSESSEKERYLERRIAEIEKQFQEFQNSFKVTGKGKGRGKKSKINEEDISVRIEKEAAKRLRSFIENESSLKSGHSSHSSHSSFVSMPLPSAPGVNFIIFVY